MAPQTDLISAMMAKNLAQLRLTPRSKPEPRAPELEVRQDRSQDAKPLAEVKAEPNSPPPNTATAPSSSVNLYLTEEHLSAIREELKRNTPGPASATTTTTTTTSNSPSSLCSLSTPELATGKGKAKKKKKSKKVHWREEMMKPYNQYKADKRAAYDNLLERK
ncbi:hypothetical protein LTR70_005437 [Exophiala xenobiotica]|uniref:Uncharacterized protein n=1 Tax=Lithohypha guttulata TaxID=1690604 RepID=A0ABR0K9Q0_9EURO|nr:hypothetical protein LTR24_005179 [Lithohypha guttulata]KAK5318415.1 hypothetical protein LTR70_005437 [Exophiala xenobiotica]